MFFRCRHNDKAKLNGDRKIRMVYRVFQREKSAAAEYHEYTALKPVNKVRFWVKFECKRSIRIL